MKSWMKPQPARPTHDRQKARERMRQGTADRHARLVSHAPSGRDALAQHGTLSDCFDMSESVALPYIGPMCSKYSLALATLVAASALAQTPDGLKPYVIEDARVLVLDHVRVIDGTGAAAG